MTLSELVAEIKAGSKLAEEKLFNRLRDRYLMTCWRYVKNLEDAEERMLDGFYKFFTTVHSFKYHHDEGLYIWIRTIMINECLMHLRSSSFFRISAESEYCDVSSQEQIMAGLGAEEILKLVHELPLGYRTVFNLFVIDGVTHAEIATMLGITSSTSRSQLTKAKISLQKMILTNESYVKQATKEIMD